MKKAEAKVVKCAKNKSWVPINPPRLLDLRVIFDLTPPLKKKKKKKKKTYQKLNFLTNHISYQKVELFANVYPHRDARPGHGSNLESVSLC